MCAFFHSTNFKRNNRNKKEMVTAVIMLIRISPGKNHET